MGAHVGADAIAAAGKKISEEMDRIREKQNKPLEDWHNKLQDAADRIHDAMETPLEKMRRELGELTELHDTHRLGDTDFKRATLKARKDFQDSLPKPQENGALVDSPPAAAKSSSRLSMQCAAALATRRSRQRRQRRL